MSDFDKAIVLVTGASSGLGRAIAVETARRGAARVAINFASDEGGAAETARLVGAFGAEALLVRGDVSKDADCRNIAQALAPFGHLDALFNNAGRTKFVPPGDLEASSSEDFQDIFAVNVVGAYQMVRATRSLLEEAPGIAAVVNTSSIAGITGAGSSIAYSVSKGALNTLTLSLARALAPRIRVNAICPGFIDTPWFGKGLPPQVADSVRARSEAISPLKVASTAEDIASTAVFLASPGSAHMTGETLRVDAGLHLTTG